MGNRNEIEFKQELERLRSLDKSYKSLKIGVDITNRELEVLKQRHGNLRKNYDALKGSKRSLESENERLRNLIEAHNNKFMSRKIGIKQ